ncbi:MAG TPA: M1 family metallopeptidase [Arachidicoccus sp.]|nr:M1 family metallopeptidase [Arachidicoccus sp.]
MNNGDSMLILRYRNNLWLLILLFSTIFNAPKATAQKLHLCSESQPENLSLYYKWWNLLHYTIDIQPDYQSKSIQGTNKIRFVALQEGQVVQIDLQSPMEISHVGWNKVALAYKRIKDAYLITFPRKIRKGEVNSIEIIFHGKPIESHKPPFDNGWIWQKDKKNNPWISIACEGSGASIWLPCKEVLYDEPDNGVLFNINVPDSLVAVANGRLIQKIKHRCGTTSYQWKVVSPINNYNIVAYIGKYKTWHQNHLGKAGNLDCDFWVLNDNVNKAKLHFKQVDTMLNCFEYWLGKYPFYKDGYKIVEAPMPGMEHQSAIAYGNKFENGYNGYDISTTGWGLKWDFILVHESSHEWFGNSITSCDNSNTWLHEGFAKYMETIYTDYVFGKAAGNAYAIGTWKKIKNDEPIIGNNTSDRYYKGSAMLHIIRQIIGDAKFRGWLHQLNLSFYHATVNTEQVLDNLNKFTGQDFTKIFEQYLHTIQVPELAYYFDKNLYYFRWTNCVANFSMPVKIQIGKERQIILPTAKWNKITIKSSDRNTIIVDSNLYINSYRSKL